MTKKIIAAASIAGVLVLGAGAFALGAFMNTPATADEDYKTVNGLIENLKVGRYYRVNGTKDEYIEVYNDGTLQFFGFDYLKEVTELNSDYVASLDESGYAEFVDSYRDLVDFWNGRNYYWLSEYVKSIHLDDEKPEPGQLAGRAGHCLSYTDENTIKFDDNHIYKFDE
ncbi:MAG: hypothetical protein HDT42_11815 [Ruminococcaceae bacterium]|nr:hypothetical protein [Oscillospiraceae bacterium]